MAQTIPPRAPHQTDADRIAQLISPWVTPAMAVADTADLSGHYWMPTDVLVALWGQAGTR
jgi:hypothetical protein